jgi:rhamnulokinase
MLHRLGIPVKIMPEILIPGSRLGVLQPHLAEATKLGPVPVYATASHDTASAVAAVPAHSNGLDWCYISSGTWSLMGVELPEPLIDSRALELNFTNEVGVGGRIRFLKNIAGLWLLQECRRTWAEEGHEYSYEDLAALAAEAGAAQAAIDVDAFLYPGEMPLKIAAWCRANGQPVPHTHGHMARRCPSKSRRGAGLTASRFLTRTAIWRALSSKASRFDTKPCLRASNRCSEHG